MNKNYYFKGYSMEKLYNITQTAKLLATSRVSIYKWIKNGKLNYVDINGHIRVRESEIKRLRGEK